MQGVEINREFGRIAFGQANGLFLYGIVLDLLIGIAYFRYTMQVPQCAHYGQVLVSM